MIDRLVQVAGRKALGDVSHRRVAISISVGSACGLRLQLRKGRMKNDVVGRVTSEGNAKRQRAVAARGLLGAALCSGVLSSACGGAASDQATGFEQGSGAFALEGDFVPLRKGRSAPDRQRERALVSAPELPDSDADFYLAIKRSSLGERWFLSAYMKQLYPWSSSEHGHKTFGTRVVSFELQNDRLFVFDASERYRASLLADPVLLIEAYPIVSSPEFEALPGAEDYVLIDPARGLNDFSVSESVYADPYLQGALGSEPLRVGLSFMQNFRELEDGAAFEQVFAGDAVVFDQLRNVWGTLGISLRRYAEGQGFVPTPDPGAPFYFSSSPRLVPDSGGQVVANPLRWNARRGMRPIQVSVSAGAFRAQADLPGADILGALTRGIESWNDAFGFEVLEAVFVDADTVPDDDSTFLLVDYPGIGAGSAFADLRENPNTGEIRGGSVYLSGVFFDFSTFAAAEPAEAAAETEGEGEGVSLSAPVVGWGSATTLAPRCTLGAAQWRPRKNEPERDVGSLSADETGALYIEHIVMHEIGHMLGLRHNFKGSLLPASSSVMDYLNPDEALAMTGPGDYDVAAIRHLYQLSPDLPAQPFCTDEGVLSDPDCTRYDRGAAPLYDWWVPFHTALLDWVIDGGAPIDVLESTLNDLLAYARAGADGGASPEDGIEALRAALGRVGVPLGEEDRANPGVVEASNAVAERVLRRVALDPSESRGRIWADVTDPAVSRFLSEELGKLVRNEDGIRSPELRRVGVDALKALQSQSALLELRAARERLVAERSSASTAAEQLPSLDDLSARIDAALTPYFD